MPEIVLPSGGVIRRIEPGRGVKRRNASLIAAFE
mgnify:CR=1 FL=1